MNHCICVRIENGQRVDVFRTIYQSFVIIVIDVIIFIAFHVNEATTSNNKHSKFYQFQVYHYVSIKKINRHVWNHRCLQVNGSHIMLAAVFVVVIVYAMYI